MCVAQNMKLVQETWQALMNGDLATALGNMYDDVTWFIPGNLPVSGLKKGKDAIREIAKGMSPAVAGGLQWEMKHIFGDRDAVIIEVSSRFTTTKGKLYENDYCFIFELEGGKIRCFREYVDTQKIKEALFA